MELRIVAGLVVRKTLTQSHRHAVAPLTHDGPCWEALIGATDRLNTPAQELQTSRQMESKSLCKKGTESCQNKKHWNAHAGTNARARQLQPRPASSSAKRYTTSAAVSTERSPPSRPLRLGFPRRAGRE